MIIPGGLKMKKLTTLFIIIVMFGFISVSTVSAQGNVLFDDVEESSAHHHSIYQLVDQGILSGYPSGDYGRIFKPNDGLSRAHAAVIFSRYLGYDENNQSLDALATYRDIDRSHPYAKAIAFVTDQGIFKGSSDVFMPNALLRRDQMATVIARAFNLSDYQRDYSVNIYTDNVGPSHKDSVKLLSEHGLTTELQNFRPSKDITRGQFASFLYRTSQLTLTPTKNEDPIPEITESQRNAVRSAKSYLDYSSFSRQGLIDQLEYEGYTHADAIYGVEQSGADWMEQAIKSAKSYLDYSSFSREGLIDQLEYEGFTRNQALYGTEQSGADWMEQAIKSAKSYLDYSSFSREGLIDQLEYEGFTRNQALYGTEQSGADWMEQAIKSAKSYLDYSSFSREGLIDQLEYEGFTTEEAIYGVDSTGL